MADRGGAPDVIVVGGGFAGLAAATALAERGARVKLLEGRPHLGGRARSWIDPDTGDVVDNGEHLFMGCYRETLAFLSRIGTLDLLELQPRLEFSLVEPGGEVGTFRLPRLPNPINLIVGFLRFPKLGLRDRFGLLRVAREIRRCSRPNSRGASDVLDRRSVAAWLESLGQSEEADRHLWHPLAIAALNESPGRASAGMFTPVLREAFLSGASGARLGIPKIGLSDLYAHPAAEYLRGKGCEVRLRSRVRRLMIEGGRCLGVLLENGERLSAAAVISAVPPPDLLELLSPGIANEPCFAGVGELETSPIVSIHLWLSAPITEVPFAALVGGRWQWIFNHRALPGGGRGTQAITLICSAAHDLVRRPTEALVRIALDDLRIYFPESRGAELRRTLVIKEKRATISPRPGSTPLRPPFRSPHRGLHLAGDWTATGLPATIEGAVLSGHACARQVREDRTS